MKKILFAASMLLCTACLETSGDLVYRGHNWTVMQINDSVLLCTPSGDNKEKPFLINIKDFSTTEFDKETTITNEF